MFNHLLKKKTPWCLVLTTILLGFLIPVITVPANQNDIYAHSPSISGHIAADVRLAATTAEELADTPEDYDTPSTPSDDVNGDGVIDIQDNKIFIRIMDIVSVLSVGIGVIITVVVVVAGIKWATSRGDPQATASAVKLLSSAGVALLLFIFGWALLNWLVPGGISPT